MNTIDTFIKLTERQMKDWLIKHIETNDPDDYPMTSIAEYILGLTDNQVSYEKNEKGDGSYEIYIMDDDIKNLKKYHYMPKEIKIIQRG